MTTTTPSTLTGRIYTWYLRNLQRLANDAVPLSWTPNMVCATRLPLSIASVSALWLGQTFYAAGSDYSLATTACFSTSFVLMLAGEFSDILDGALATVRGQQSNFGKLFDPVQDSAARFTQLMGLYAVVHAGWFPLLLLFVYRDTFVNFMRQLYALKYGESLSARGSGKIKGFAQFLTICISYLLIAIYGPTEWVVNAASALMVVMTCITVWSAHAYAVTDRTLIEAFWDDRLLRRNDTDGRGSSSGPAAVSASHLPAK